MAGANGFLQDVAGALGPDEWFEFAMVTRDVVVDGGDQLRHAGEHAAANYFGGNAAKESLDHV